MNTVEQLLEQIEFAEQAGLADVGPAKNAIRQAGSIGEAVEILLRAGIEASVVFRWADISVQEARQLVTDPELRAQGGVEEVILREGPALDGSGEGATETADSNQLTPATEVTFDDRGFQIVGYDADGNAYVADPVNPGQVVPAYFIPEEQPGLLGGLPEGFAVQNQDEIQMLDKIGGPNGAIGQYVYDAVSQPREARYREGDQVGEFGGMSTEMSKQISQALVAAGYLDADIDEVYGGTWTADHARAMAIAMTEANMSGRTWSAQLQRRARQVEEAGGLDALTGNQRSGRTFVAPAYREPDYATLAQEAKALFRGNLNRDPLDWEMELLADEMSKAYRSQYDSEVQAQRQQFDAGNHATTQAEGGDNVFATAGSVQTVDPRARAAERFESLYANEIELQQDRAEGLQNVSNVFSRLTQVSSMMGR